MDENRKIKCIACKDCSNCGFDGKEHYCKVNEMTIDNALYYTKSYCGDSERK